LTLFRASGNNTFLRSTKTSYGLAAICMVPSWGPETPLATRQLANGSAGVHCCHCCHCCDSCSPRLWVCNASNHDASLPAAPQPWHFICPTFNGPRRPINTLRVGGTASTQKTRVLFASPTTPCCPWAFPSRALPCEKENIPSFWGRWAIGQVWPQRREAPKCYGRGTGHDGTNADVQSLNLQNWCRPGNISLQPREHCCKGHTALLVQASADILVYCQSFHQPLPACREPAGTSSFATSSCFRQCMKGGLLNLHLPGELLAITHKRSYEAVCQVNVIT